MRDGKGKAIFAHPIVPTKTALTRPLPVISQLLRCAHFFVWSTRGARTARFI